MATVFAIGFAGLLSLAAIFVAQDRLLYFPAKATVERMAGDGLEPWPSAADFRGLVAEPGGPVRATAIVFHGNAGHAGHRAYYARALVPLGLRVILAEYPGYGPRAGALGEASLVADASETVALAYRRYGGPLLLMGESLGAAVAAAAAAEQADRVAGLLLLTPWDQLARVGAYHYPWLPVRWMLRDEYDNTARLAAFDRPAIVAVAEHDRIVPAPFGTALYDSLQGPAHLVVIRGSDHNDWPDRVDAGWWRARVETLLDGSR
ncbi:alpha/beta hydrolase [Ramlibacter sp. AW1]|uniref:Alpha/beta hydrolase n=1 Tax=Ramlibacter aurantiacus TaxID=2801330 RepID=A0A937D3G4_9BURK|nr:alpha/beta fold hydrolase [Ramlibacter aurantiacus]MBL0419317.1 alpha/beta hydrolase [Ramlibacter aurantiacus]